MPKKQIISSERLGTARAPLSPAVRFGNLVFVQGVAGRSADGTYSKDVKVQTRAALERVKEILAEAGTVLDNALSCTCYVARREDLPGFNEVYAQYFPANRPARTAVIVSFGAPENLVEITVTAGIPD